MNHFSQYGGKTILYMRVSTKSQEVDMQIFCGERMISSLDISETDLITLTDHGVSARNTKMHQRPGLAEAMKLIKSGQVKNFVTYDRCRIARRTSQYIQFLQLCIDHGVQIILTKSKVAPVTDDIGNEARLALLAERDGNLIAERSKDGQVYYPNAPLGYRREGQRGDKHYVQTDEIDHVIEIFRGFKHVTTLTEYRVFENAWKINEVGIDVSTILSNFFYAAHTLKDGLPEPLNHVEAIIDLETVIKNRDQLSRLGVWTSTKVTYYESLFPDIPVVCVLCGETLVVKHSKGDSLYRCTHGKRSKSSNTVSIAVADVDKAIEQGIMTLLRQFSHKKVEAGAQVVINKLLRGFSEKLEYEKGNLVDLRRQLVRCPDGLDSVWSILEMCNEVVAKTDEIKCNISELEQIRKNIRSLRSEVVRCLATGTYHRVHELARLFLTNVLVDSESIKLAHKGTEYFDFKEAN